MGMRGGFGAGAGGVGEDVEVGEGVAVDEGEGGGVVGSVSPGKPAITSAPMAAWGRRSWISSTRRA